MKISVFGLGYVGCVSAACLAENGHHVIGVDIDSEKVSTIQRGKSPIVEPGLSELIARIVGQKLIEATMDVTYAIQKSEVSLICVGTPSLPNGEMNLSYVGEVCEKIGKGLKSRNAYHVVVLRSTVLPGTTEEFVLPILEKTSGKSVGKDFGLVFNPEFMREGSAIADFYNPPRTVIGEWDEKSGEIVASLYQHLSAPLIRTKLRVAEMVKYADNAFHALKVAFANEIGNFCKSEGIDSHDVMDIFCLDKKLNLSPAYLKPGYAFGGSCLTKDLRALLHRIKSKGLDTPVLESILPSNEIQKLRGVNLIRSLGKKKIGILGLSFKEGTSDLRESPTIDLIEALLKDGYSILIYDPCFSESNPTNCTVESFKQKFPQIANLCASLGEVLSFAEIIVVTNKERIFLESLKELRKDQILVDLVYLSDLKTSFNGKYYGINW